MEIGRRPDNHIVIDDVSVSRRHAVLRRVGNKYILEDFHSSNGTYVNGKKINSVEVKNLDRIQIGSSTLIFHEEKQSSLLGLVSLAKEKGIDVEVKKELGDGDVFSSKTGPLFTMIIRELKKKHAISDKDLSHLLGVSLPTVIKWTKEEAFPNRTYLRKLVELQNMSLKDLRKMMSDGEKPKKKET